ncbi:MAG: DUF1501 domain-containing protein [Verrucomicrobia bacterium]|nr:DUF1501 domain-containing protein [Verrucomicrobiota bacterium]
MILRTLFPSRLADRVRRDMIANLMKNCELARGWVDAFLFHFCLVAEFKRQLYPSFSRFGCGMTVNLSEENEATRDRYGRTTYGQGCLLARRLVEGGAKMVTVYFSNNIGGQSTSSGGWDTHGFNNTRMYPIIEQYHLPITEQTLPTLLTDLDERGLLESTLVVWMGEFGRTPKINENASRDHWPQCFTVLLAGGGVKRGFVYGESDKSGAYPAKDPVRLEDLAATFYDLLGIDPHTEVFNTVNRPVLIAEGRPLSAIYS